MPEGKTRPFTALEWEAAVARAYDVAAEHGTDLMGVQLFMTGPAGYATLFADSKVFGALRGVGKRQRDARPGAGRYIVHGHYMTATVWDMVRGVTPALGRVEAQTPDQKIVNGARNHLAGQLFACTGFAAEGVITHLPSLAPDVLADCAADVASRAERRLAAGPQRPGNPPVRLWLETAPEHPRGGKWGYARAGEIRSLVEALDNRGLITSDRRGFGGAGLCIDSAHLWAQGNSDVTTYEGFEEILRPAREAIGRPLPFMAHLNDCSLPLGAGRDIHAPVGQGLIWRDCADHLAASGAAAMIDLAEELKGLAVLERRADHVADYIALGRL